MAAYILITGNGTKDSVHDFWGALSAYYSYRARQQDVDTEACALWLNPGWEHIAMYDRPDPQADRRMIICTDGADQYISRDGRVIRRI